MLGRLLKGKKPKDPVDEQEEAEEQAWYEIKSQYFESVLGEEHGTVMHAIIPFAVGGGLDLYYYPNSIPGTAIATKELVGRHGNGPSNEAYSAYSWSV